MKVAYKKNIEIKLFGIKLLTMRSDYIEHSIEKEDDDNGLFIDLENRIVNIGDKKC